MHALYPESMAYIIGSVHRNPFTNLTRTPEMAMVFFESKDLPSRTALENFLSGKDDTEADHLIHSAKMSALGQIMAGIVHEINTPLAYVTATFSLLSRLLEELLVHVNEGTNQSVRFDVQSIENDIRTLMTDGNHGLSQLSKLVSSLKNFSRLDSDAMIPCSISSILEDALLMSNNKLKYMEVTKSIEDVPLVVCSASQIEQVLLNIMMNAAQAIEQTARHGKIHVSITRRNRDHVAIAITDNGPGIPPEIQEKIFEPFFTTKPVGTGTGLGLSICYRIINNHHGHIAISSNPETGTTFTIILPIKGS